jgi:sec-independent protein translocase protein TatA
MNIGAPEIILIILAILLLFGYKKLPAASRSLGQSLRIFKGEMKGMKSDDVADKDAATVTQARGELTAPLPRDADLTAPLPRDADLTAPLPRDADLTAQLQDEARAAELRAAELRARAEQSGTVDGSR